MSEVDLTKNKILSLNKTNTYFQRFSLFSDNNDYTATFSLMPVGKQSFEHTEEEEYNFVCARCGKKIRYIPWENNDSLCKKCSNIVSQYHIKIPNCFYNEYIRPKNDEVLLL